MRQIITERKLLDRQAKTDDPYKKILSNPELPTIAPAPIIKIPVPRKNDRAIEIPKYFLKIIFINTYKLAQPRLIISLPKIAQISEPAETLKDAPTKAPASTVPRRYVTHIHIIEKAPIAVFEII